MAGAEQDGRRLIVALLGIGGAQRRLRASCSTGPFANADRLSPIGQLPAVPRTPPSLPNRRAPRIPTMSLPFRPRRRTRP